MHSGRTERTVINEVVGRAGREFAEYSIPLRCAPSALELKRKSDVGAPGVERATRRRASRPARHEMAPLRFAETPQTASRREGERAAPSRPPGAPREAPHNGPLPVSHGRTPAPEPHPRLAWSSSRICRSTSRRFSRRSSMHRTSSLLWLWSAAPWVDMAVAAAGSGRRVRLGRAPRAEGLGGAGGRWCRRAPSLGLGGVRGGGGG